MLKWLLITLITLMYADVFEKNKYSYNRHFISFNKRGNYFTGWKSILTNHDYLVYSLSRKYTH